MMTDAVSGYLPKSGRLIHTDVEGEGNGSGQDESSHQFDEDDKLHTEAEGTTEVADQDQLHQVVDSRVDPTATLREQNAERVGNGSLANGLGDEDLLSLGEGAEHESCQVTILTEQQKILLMQRVDDVLGVVLDDIGVGQDRNPVVLSSLGRLDAVHAETAGQAGDTTKDRLEGLGQVMGDEVLEDLDGGDPAVSLVGNLRFAAKTHDLGILDHGGNHMSQTVGEDLRIGVDHEHYLIKVRRDTRNLPETIEHFVLELGHTLIKHDLLEEGHQNDLTVTLATVAGLRLGSLIGGTTLDDKQNGDPLLLLERNSRLGTVIVESGVDLGHVVSLGATGDRHV